MAAILVWGNHKAQSRILLQCPARLGVFIRGPDRSHDHFSDVDAVLLITQYVRNCPKRR